MALDPALNIEVWTEYAISICFFFLRFFTRFKLLGFRNLDAGDAFALMAMIFYSLETSGIYLLSGFGYNVGLNAQTALAVPDDQVASLAMGSKLAFINWIWYINLLWSLKGVLMVIYFKLGTGVPRQELIVKLVAGLVVCTWLASLLTHICGCTPVYKGWQIKPYPGDRCTLRQANYIVIGVLNCVSDMAIILVPMPLLFKVKVPPRHKLVLIALFSLGLFVVVATILRSYYSLRSLDSLTIALGWASRETMAATIVACAPGIKPLFSGRRWYNSASDHSGNKLSYEPKSMSRKASARRADISVTQSVDVTSTKNPMAFDFELNNWVRPHGSSGESDERRIMCEERAESHKADDVRSATFTTEQVVKTKDQV
ncbi:hypothetical protein AC578_739 [Lecanosticta acicola]|uniref:Rhodopsin domain-containing protein n=1 Tax=Lecanosticta acicola TaxID=111012 RepID=A0AAI9EF15_9PEZI|nr:hypothetical protein AC578_739 [Lecanosticta acicola]